MTEKPPAEQKKRSNKSGIASRRVAVEVLMAIENDGAYSTNALNAAFKKIQLSDRDRAFVTALVQGAVRHRMELDEKIASMSKQPLDKLSPTLKNILRIAFFQLEQMSDIRASAVVDTSTELAKTMGHQGQARFANGVLRNYLRHAKPASEGTTDDTAAQLDITDVNAMSVKFSMPLWLVQRWMSVYGAEETVQLLQFAQTKPELTVRVCNTAITVEGLEEVFRNKKIQFHRGKLVESCLILDGKNQNPEKLPGYAEGLFTVQDESAAFVSIVMDPKPGELIVDLCAAPGGKSLHMAEMMDNTGRVVAVDKHESRLNLLKQNRNRLGLTNIEVAAGDARSFQLEKQADRVLLDAPCTGTGVINRRSDLRYRREPIDVVSLSELQKELLAAAAKLVKPGGVLVYSTCSIEPEENFDNIRWFMREFPEFQGDDLSKFLPAELLGDVESKWGGPACKTEAEMTAPYMIQLLPSRHGVSGFFICRLRKQESL